MMDEIEYYNEIRKHSVSNIENRENAMRTRANMMIAQFANIFEAAEENRQAIGNFIKRELERYDKDVIDLQNYCQKRIYGIVQYVGLKQFIIGYGLDKEGLENYRADNYGTHWDLNVIEIYDASMRDMLAKLEKKYIVLNYPIDIMDLQQEYSLDKYVSLNWLYI